jgi:hypothetical protein
VTLNPSNLTSIAPGNFYTVTVSAPAAPNAIVPINFYRGRTLTGTATMMKEFTSSTP